MAQELQDLKMHQGELGKAEVRHKRLEGMLSLGHDVPEEARVRLQSDAGKARVNVAKSWRLCEFCGFRQAQFQ